MVALARRASASSAQSPPRRVNQTSSPLPAASTGNRPPPTMTSTPTTSPAWPERVRASRLSRSQQHQIEAELLRFDGLTAHASTFDRCDATEARGGCRPARRQDRPRRPLAPQWRTTGRPPPCARTHDGPAPRIDHDVGADIDIGWPVAVACLAWTLAWKMPSPGWTRVEQLDATYALTRHYATLCDA